VIWPGCELATTGSSPAQQGLFTLVGVSNGARQARVTWVRLDGALPQHPKLLAVGVPGFYVYVRGLCYAGQYLTDGLIPSVAVPGLLAGLETIRLIEGTRSRGHLKLGQDACEVNWPQRLVDAGLWADDPDGYRIVNYGQYNPDKATYEARLDQLKQAARRGGLQRAQRLTPEARTTIARKAARIRWHLPPEP